MRTTFLVFAVITLSGCANTRDSRRPACAACEAEKPTLLRRLGLGRPPGKKPPEAPPAVVELVPQPDTTGVESVPGISPTLGVEPMGVGRPRTGAGRAVEGGAPGSIVDATSDGR
jgi:hypothetical protein